VIRDLPASVRQRLLNRSRETRRPFQELLAYYAMERFLYRLGQSSYADRFVLKGALMFTVWGARTSSPTKDIDLLVLSRQFDFDGATLSNAIVRTFTNRSTDVQAVPIALTVAFSSDVTKQTQWEGFLRKTKLDSAPTSLQSVIDELTPFLRPIATAIWDQLPFAGRWVAPGPWQIT
jgi:hypothetical protein